MTQSNEELGYAVRKVRDQLDQGLITTAEFEAKMLEITQYGDSRADQITHRLQKLRASELEAVMVEAAIQFGCREEGSESTILDFIENGLDMLRSGEYGYQHDPQYARLVLVHKATGI